MTSTLGIKKIQYPNGTNIITLDSSGSTAISGTLDVAGAFTSLGIDDNADAIAITINSSEQVGIGESSPLGTLHVRTSDASLSSVNANADDLIIENNGNCGISICSSTSGEGNINFIDNGDTNIGRIQYTHSSNEMIFRVNDAERMRIKDYGSILIGTTNASPAEGTSNGVRIGGNGTSQFSSNGDAGLSSNRTADNGNAITLRRDGTVVGSISVTGSSTSYNTSSDYRLKENVNYEFNATSRIKQLKPCRFNFITDTDTTIDGFIAHEVSDIIPEAIFGEKDATNKDGSINAQSIDQSKLVPLLVKTIQELEARITELESK